MMSSLTSPPRKTPFCYSLQPKLDILYEDEHILLVNKRPGMVVHADETEQVNTLHQSHSGLSLSKKGVEPLLGELLCPGPVQPD